MNFDTFCQHWKEPDCVFSGEKWAWLSTESAADTEPADTTLPRAKCGEHREKGAKLKSAANTFSSSVSQKNKSALKADAGRMSRSVLPFPGALTSSCSGRGNRLRGRRATTHSPHSGTEIQTSQTHPNLLVTHLGETTTSQSKQPVQTLSLHLSCWAGFSRAPNCFSVGLMTCLLTTEKPIHQTKIHGKLASKGKRLLFFVLILRQSSTDGLQAPRNKGLKAVTLAGANPVYWRVKLHQSGANFRQALTTK